MLTISDNYRWRHLFAGQSSDEALTPMRLILLCLLLTACAPTGPEIIDKVNACYANLMMATWHGDDIVCKPIPN